MDEMEILGEQSSGQDPSDPQRHSHTLPVSVPHINNGSRLVNGMARY